MREIIQKRGPSLLENQIIMEYLYQFKGYEIIKENLEKE